MHAAIQQKRVYKCFACLNSISFHNCDWKKIKKRFNVLWMCILLAWNWNEENNEIEWKLIESITRANGFIVRFDVRSVLHLFQCIPYIAILSSLYGWKIQWWSDYYHFSHWTKRLSKWLNFSVLISIKSAG